MGEPQTAKRSPRKGARIGLISELSVFLKVKPGREQVIRESFTPPWWKAVAEVPEQKDVVAQLETIETASVKAAVQAVVDVGTVHNARYVLFDNDTRLLVSTTFDGDWDVYIDDFAASKVLDVWDTFLIHCEGYPDEGKASLTLDEVKEFLTEYQVTAADFFLRYPGVTTKEILEALRVQAAVQESLDNPGAGEALQHPALKPLREVAAD
jgi:hypothetical protein